MTDFAVCTQAMNQKNLNYEIETPMRIMFVDIGNFYPEAMNQKNLNYEIETVLTGCCSCTTVSDVDYESKESQL